MQKYLTHFTGRTLGLSIALALGVTFTAGAQIVPKQLSGPPSDFQSMRSPDPVESAIHSHSAMVPVSMIEKKGGTGWSSTIPVEDNALRFALLTPGGMPWDVSLSGPSGQKLRAADTAKSARASSFGMGEAQVPAQMYSFPSLASGNWKIELEGSAKAASQGYLLIEGSASTGLTSYPTHSRQLVGQAMGLTAQLTALDASEKAITGAGAGRIERAEMEVTAPSGKIQRMAMFDDGRHDDGAAGDGIFGAAFTASEAGSHVAQVVIEGVDRNGNRVLRTAEHLLAFVNPTLSLAGSRATATAAKSATPRLTINIPVTAPKNASHYRSYAEVWGRDARGNEVPVAWVGGMVTPEAGKFGLGFDERWIAKSGAQAPFELRNLRIEDPDTSVTIASSARMGLSLPALRVRAKAADIEIDEMMTMGPRPVEAAQAKGVGKRLLLVHGYCSGGVWPAAQFGTSSTFLDKNQNRSHDYFARLIKSFGSTWNSFGVVAHSQGGAASLHLYTYYWSGLDNATGSRLIQSVGTPYKGTNLAGILAKLGNWFGVGCGKNTDLSYSGASAWLAGIPNSARAKVNYYTTSFKLTNWYTNDYCNAATDLVLSDPEDGTTEKANGQLPGAVNRGHVEGQCHTAGMRDPAQYLNASRNATMNSNAAR